MNAPELRHLTFAAYERCICGAGMAHDDSSAWDCSAILLGDAIPSGHFGSVRHTARLPFALYEIKSENQKSARGASTRPELLSHPEDASAEVAPTATAGKLARP